MERICHQDFDAQEIAARYPAQLSDRNKQIVFDASSPPGANHSGTISFSRCRQMRLPDTVVRHRIHPSFELRRDFFTYGHHPRAGSFGILTLRIMTYSDFTAVHSSHRMKCRLPSIQLWHRFDMPYWTRDSIR